jgi:Leucine-rich repeat (LRR) protein
MNELQDIRVFGDLVSVSLMFNKLSSLPSSLSELTRLKQLNASNNAITSLPMSLFDCRYVRT